MLYKIKVMFFKIFNIEQNILVKISEYSLLLLIKINQNIIFP